jgi:hypothetical protein
MNAGQAVAAQDIEMYAAALEADQANRDFMSEWINGSWIDGSLSHPYVAALRSYRDAAERAHDQFINAQISAISVREMTDVTPEHIDYPHWPGTLYDCPACAFELGESDERDYDEREYLGDEPNAHGDTDHECTGYGSLGGSYPCQTCYPDGN